MLTDAHYMRMALQEAEAAFAADEVPVGAVITCGGELVGKGRNQTEQMHDVTAHAEMLALTAASHRLGAKYLPKCTLYVTLEPCVMCAGAIFWAQVGRLVYGAPDPKRGYARVSPPLLHPKTQITTGVEAEAATALLRRFFGRLRNT